MSLRIQTISGLMWTFMDTFFLKGLSFIASLMLARLLGPSDFGLIGMISIFIGIGVSLVDSGLSASLIRTQNVDDKDFSTVFYLNLSMSCLVYALLYFSAPFIAGFYDQEILTGIIRLYCVGFIISAFSAVQIAILNRDMKFKKVMKLNIPGTLIGVGVGISLGYLDYGVWSIVWMYISTQFVQSFMLWITSSWKPSLTFDKKRMKYHYGFGYKLMLSGLLNTGFQNIYNVVIGKFFPVQILGFYDRAYSFNQFPVSTLVSIINRVTYPMLARIQSDTKRISNVYQQLIKFTFFLSAPLMIGAAALAKPLFLLALGDQWLPAVPFFQILCLAGMLLPIHSFNLNILKVYGRSDLFLKLEILKKAVVGFSIIIAFHFGIYGLVWSSVISSIIALIINTHYCAPFINYSTKRQFLDLIPTLVLSGLMFLVMACLLIAFGDGSFFFSIFVPSLAGTIFYFSVSYMMKVPSLIFLIKLINKKNL